MLFAYHTTQVDTEQAADVKPSRIDGGDLRRETIFTTGMCV